MRHDTAPRDRAWQDYKRDLHRANVIRSVLHGAALGSSITALSFSW